MRDRVFQHKCQNQKHQKYPISHVMGVVIYRLSNFSETFREIPAHISANEHTHFSQYFPVFVSFFFNRK